MSSVMVAVLIIIIGAVIIILLFIKNNKDRKALNPDATDAVEEAEGDLERKKDKA